MSYAFVMHVYSPISSTVSLVECMHRQGVTQDLETGGQNLGFLKFRGSKVSNPIYKNDHSNLIY